MEKLLPCGVPGLASQGRKVKDMCKTLAGQGTYFWMLSMLGISTDPLNTVPEHMGVIHAFINHETKKEDDPKSLDEEREQRWVCLPRASPAYRVWLGHRYAMQPTSAGQTLRTYSAFSHIFVLLMPSAHAVANEPSPNTHLGFYSCHA